jgi:HlyD family secretion protein
MRRALVVVLLLVAAGAWFRPPAVPERRRTTVRAHPLRKTVVEAAFLAAVDTSRMYSPCNATVVQIVPEGTRVKKGEFVAKLSAPDLEEKLRDRTHERDTAQLELAIKQGEFAVEEFEVKNRLAAARRELEVARLQLEIKKHELDYPQLARLGRELEASSVMQATYHTEVSQMTPWVEKGYIAKKNLDEMKMQEATSGLDHEAQSLDRSLVSSGTTIDKRAEAAKSVATAQSSLDVAQMKLQSFLQRRTDTIAELKARIASADSALKSHLSEIAELTQKAPVDGVVKLEEVYSMSGEEKCHVGSEVPQGYLFAQVVSPRRMRLEAKIAEADVHLIKVGQLVEFQVDAIPETVYHGRVSKMAPGISGGLEERYIFPVFREVTIEADAETDDPRLLPGMSAVAEIVVQEQPKALWLDVAAVDGDVVHRTDGRTVPVVFGYSKGLEVEVLSGLHEGDELWCRPSPKEDELVANSTVETVTAREFFVKVKDRGALKSGSETAVYLHDLIGKPVLQKLADDGKLVKKGDIIAEVSTSEIEDKIKQAKVELTVAEKDREVALAQGLQDAQTFGKELDVASKDLDVARLDQKITLRGKKPREVEDLVKALAVVESDIQLLSRKIEIYEKLAKQGYTSQQELKAKRQELLRRRVDHDEAKTKLERARIGATDLEREQARGKVEQCQLDYELKKRKVETCVAKQKLQVAKADLTIVKARRYVERLQRMIKSTTVRAPVSGMAVRTSHWSEEGFRKFRETDQIRQDYIFLNICNVSEFSLTGVVSEAHALQVKAGQAVQFSLTAFPTELFRGTLKSIGLMGQTRPGDQFRHWQTDQNPRVFEVEITVPVRGKRFQPEAPVDFVVQLKTIPDALTIPEAGLHFDARGAYVYMETGQIRRVVAGGEDSGLLWIQSGLKKGEKILVPRHR